MKAGQGVHWVQRTLARAHTGHQEGLVFEMPSPDHRTGPADLTLKCHCTSSAHSPPWKRSAPGCLICRICRSYVRPCSTPVRSGQLQRLQEPVRGGLGSQPLKHLQLPPWLSMHHFTLQAQETEAAEVQQASQGHSRLSAPALLRPVKWTLRPRMSSGVRATFLNIMPSDTCGVGHFRLLLYELELEEVQGHSTFFGMVPGIMPCQPPGPCHQCKPATHTIHPGHHPASLNKYLRHAWPPALAALASARALAVLAVTPLLHEHGVAQGGQLVVVACWGHSTRQRS